MGKNLNVHQEGGRMAGNRRPQDHPTPRWPARAQSELLPPPEMLYLCSFPLSPPSFPHSFTPSRRRRVLLHPPP